MQARYEPLKTITAYFLDQYDKSSGDEDKCWILAFRGLSLLHYNVSAEPKTLRLPVDKGNDVVHIPGDCVSWVKIGVVNNNGEINTLRINNALKYKGNSAFGFTPDITDGWINSNTSPYFNYYNNGFYQTFYGVGNAGLVTFGECSVDEKNNVIVLSPNFQYNDILLEYISCPEKDTDYLVDVRLREAIIAFLEWKYKVGSRQEFYAAAVEARRMIKPVNMQSFQQTIRENERMTIKV